VLAGILVFVAIMSLINGIISEDAKSCVTNFIEVGLITFVVTHKKYLLSKQGRKHKKLSNMIVSDTTTYPTCDSWTNNNNYSLNTTICVFQEGSAENAIEALKSMLSSDVILVRKGQEVKVPGNKEIIPSDVVILQTGDRVPSDIRLLEVNNLACQEAGHSTAVAKTVNKLKKSNMYDAKRMWQMLKITYSMWYHCRLSTGRPDMCHVDCFIRKRSIFVVAILAAFLQKISPADASLTGQSCQSFKKTPVHVLNRQRKMTMVGLLLDDNTKNREPRRRIGVEAGRKRTGLVENTSKGDNLK
jgi:magnesium-transporting ATPase (P-type)